MPTLYTTIQRGEAEIELEIEYIITSGGEPPHYGSLAYPGDPGDIPEFEITSTLPNEPLTEAEDSKITELIFEQIGETPDDYDDPYYPED